MSVQESGHRGRSSLTPLPLTRSRTRLSSRERPDGRGAAATLLMPSLRTDRYIDANMREIYIVLVLVTIVARRCTAPRPSCPSGSAQGFSASFTMRVRHCYALYRPTSTSTQTINKYDAHLILEIPNHRRYILHEI